MQFRHCVENLLLTLERFFQLLELARDRPQLTRHLFLVFAHLLPKGPELRHRVDGANDSKRIQTLEDRHMSVHVRQGHSCSPYDRTTDAPFLRKT